MAVILPGDRYLDIAIEWLRNNEGDGEEQAACRTVAAWLANEQANRMVRTEARRAGIPVRKLREAIAKKGIDIVD